MEFIILDFQPRLDPPDASAPCWRQAKPPAKAFIGYGGVAVRDPVRKGADWFVTDFGPLIEAIREGTEASESAE